MKKLKFDLSNKKNCSVKSFTLRETTGKDEEIAAQRAKARGGLPGMTTEELLRRAVVQVDAEDVADPYLGFDGWNSRTRGFAIAAFQSMNAADDKEVQDFLDGALDLDA